MKIRNPRGRVVKVNKDLYDRYIKKDGWEGVSQEASQFPKEKGAGWYELSDGSSVRGAQNAKTKQAELDG